MHTGTMPWSSGYYDAFLVNGRRSLAENLEWERYSEVLGRRRISGGVKNGSEEMGGDLRGGFMGEKRVKVGRRRSGVGGDLRKSEEVWRGK